MVTLRNIYTGDVVTVASNVADWLLGRGGWEVVAAGLVVDANGGIVYVDAYVLGAANATAGINAAIAALSPGWTLKFGSQRYNTDGGHVISTPSVKIEGPSGRAQTYNSSAQLYLRNGANSDMLRLATNQITIRDLSLFGNFSNQAGTSRGIVSTSADGPNYFLLDAVWVDSFNGDGISIDSLGGTVSGRIVNCESRVNKGFGLKVLGGGTDLQVTGGYIDQNAQSGVDCQSGDLSLLDLHIWGNGTAGSGDRDGITFHSAASCRVEDSYIEGQHNGAGIRFKTGANKGHIITGCDIWDNGSQGIYGFGADHCVISDNVIRQNNYSGSSGANGAGIAVDTCTAMLIEDNMMYSSGLNRQTYGYYEVGTSNVDIRFEGNMSRAADHTTGGVFLGPGTKADLGSAFVRMTADQSTGASNTTLADVTELQFAVAAGEVWELEGVLFCDGSQAGDIGVRLATPGSPSGYWQILGPRGSATSTTAESIMPQANLFDTTQQIGMLGAGVIVPAQIHGLYTVGTAGTFKVRFAQGVSDATPTILKAGSYLRARRVAQ